MAKNPSFRRVLLLGTSAVRSLCTDAMMSAEATASAATASSSYSSSSSTVIYHRLSVLGTGGAKGRVANVLDQWLKEGNRVNKNRLLGFIKELRKYKRFHHALQIMEWMEKQGTNLSYGDYAIRIDLLSKTRGIGAAENYFTSLSEAAKNQLTYGALLYCYCREKMQEKATTLFDMMKERNMVSSTLVYNNMLSLFMKGDQQEKVPPLVEEMKAANIMPDKYTYNILMNSYASLKDIEAVERVVEEVQGNERAYCDWTIYSNLAAIYVAAGLFDKANLALKKCEKFINVRDRMAFHFLISLYGGASNLAAVKRVWKSLKLAFPKTTNLSYLTMLQALARLDDLDGMKKCFEEWESGCPTYDMRLANVLINYYMRKGMTKEAELLLVSAINRASQLNFKTLEFFMDFYLKGKAMVLALKCMETAVNQVKEDEWRPSQEKVRTFLKCFEDQKDVDGAEEFCRMVKKVYHFDSVDYNVLLRTYIAAGKTEPLMRERMEEDEIEMSPESEELLEKVCQ